MKKILFIASFLINASTFDVKAQSTQDTLAILQNIVANKSNYIGQSFSTLLGQLPINIKYFLPLASPLSRNIEASTYFAFYFPTTPNQTYRTRPALTIEWQQPLNKVQSMNLRSQSNGQWTTVISQHYGTAVITDITIIE